MEQTVRCGWARLSFETVRTAFREDAGATQEHVHVRVEAGGEVEVSLVDQPLPSDVALDPRTGDWRCTVLG